MKGLPAVLVALALGGCGAAPLPEGPATVHMSDTRFLPASTTIGVGQPLTLVSDTILPHVIANGTWDGSVARPAQEPEGPLVANVTIDGGRRGAVGPFMHAGTFRLYCTIHPGMGLTVVVRDPQP